MENDPFLDDTNPLYKPVVFHRHVKLSKGIPTQFCSKTKFIKKTRMDLNQRAGIFHGPTEQNWWVVSQGRSPIGVDVYINPLQNRRINSY